MITRSLFERANVLLVHLADNTIRPVLAADDVGEELVLINGRTLLNPASTLFIVFPIGVCLHLILGTVDDSEAVSRVGAKVVVGTFD
jgi:hypothetical protein